MSKHVSGGVILPAALNLLLIFTVAAGAAPVSAQAPAHAADPSAADLQKSIEHYLRHLYAFGPDARLVVGAPQETGVPGLLKSSIELTIGENHESGSVFVSRDGKYIFRGEMAELARDPLAEARSKLDLKGAPSVGPADSAVTVVEFSDFECPVCRQLHDAVRTLLPNYPQVRLVFKDFPIEQIHPWARTAALAGRCAYQQDPKAFWKLYDVIYDNQEVISAENAYQKMTDFAGEAGLNDQAFKSCMAAPEAAAAIDASIANGKLLDVSSTPTIFVNGRRIVGADARTLEQYIRYELAQHNTRQHPATR